MPRYRWRTGRSARSGLGRFYTFKKLPVSGSARVSRWSAKGHASARCKVGRGRGCGWDRGGEGRREGSHNGRLGWRGGGRGRRGRRPGRDSRSARIRVRHRPSYPLRRSPSVPRFRGRGSVPYSRRSHRYARAVRSESARRRSPGRSAFMPTVGSRWPRRRSDSKSRAFACTFLGRRGYDICYKCRSSFPICDKRRSAQGLSSCGKRRAYWSLRAHHCSGTSGPRHSPSPRPCDTCGK